MTRFYLHLHNRIGTVPDEEGTDVSDLDAARYLAVQSVRDILSEEAKQGIIDLRGKIEIADAAGGTVAVVAFADAIQLQLGDAR